MNAFTRFLLAALASGATVTYAQTSSVCNPTVKDGCPADPALSKAVEYDLTQGAPDDFTVSTGSAPTFTKDGAVFKIAKKGDAPTLISKWYMMFGHYEIKVKVAPGTGVVSSLVLLSDDLDEIDWEWLGAKPDEVQTNYFGQGKTTTYDRGMTVANPGSQSAEHTYTLDWTSDQITWAIDGKTVRTLTPQTADAGQYPQSPMQLKIGPWVAGDVGQPQGTVEWAGGNIDWSAAAANPYTMTVTSVKAIDYSSGKEYTYGDKTGTWQSIKSNGGKISGKGDPNTPVSSAAASGTAIAATASGEASAAATHNAAVDQNAAANSTSNATATSTGKPSSPSASGTQNSTTLASSAKPFPTGNGTATVSGGSSSSAGTTGVNSMGSGQPKTGDAVRLGGSLGAMAFAAAVMVL